MTDRDKLIAASDLHIEEDASLSMLMVAPMVSDGYTLRSAAAITFMIYDVWYRCAEGGGENVTNLTGAFDIFELVHDSPEVRNHRTYASLFRRQQCEP